MPRHCAGSSLRTLVVALLVAGCAADERGVLAPTTQEEEISLRPPGLLDNLTLMSCAPLAADTTIKSIGSAGGTIAVGPHHLLIPAGALDSAVTITAIAPSDDIARVQFYPEGLEFERSVFIGINYAHCAGVGTLLPKRIVYLSPDLEILEVLFSYTNFFQSTVWSPTDHFSDYAVAW